MHPAWIGKIRNVKRKPQELLPIELSHQTVLVPIKINIWLPKLVLWLAHEPMDWQCAPVTCTSVTRVSFVTWVQSTLEALVYVSDCAVLICVGTDLGTDHSTIQGVLLNVKQIK